MNLFGTCLLAACQLWSLWTLWDKMTLIKAIKGDHRNQNLAVVVPFDERHLGDVQKMIGSSWKRFPPGRNSNNIYLYFYFSGDLARKPHVRKALEALDVPLEAFRKVCYISANLEEREDQYPAGTSLMFFRLFNHPMMQKMHAVMWMEPDVYPCRSGWLTHLYLQAFTGASYWIKGSMQRAAPDNDGFLAQADHINGNALYYRNSRAFYEFLDEVSEAFDKDARAFIESFDVAIWVVFRHNRSYAEYADLRSLYAYTDFIQNYYVRSVNATELCARNQEAFLVHGRNVLF